MLTVFGILGCPEAVGEFEVPSCWPEQREKAGPLGGSEVRTASVVGTTGEPGNDRLWSPVVNTGHSPVGQSLVVSAKPNWNDRLLQAG